MDASRVRPEVGQKEEERMSKTPGDYVEIGGGGLRVALPRVLRRDG